MVTWSRIQTFPLVNWLTPIPRGSLSVKLASGPQHEGSLLERSQVASRAPAWLQACVPPGQLLSPL